MSASSLSGTFREADTTLSRRWTSRAHKRAGPEGWPLGRFCRCVNVLLTHYAGIKSLGRIAARRFALLSAAALAIAAMPFLFEPSFAMSSFPYTGEMR